MRDNLPAQIEKVKLRSIRVEKEKKSKEQQELERNVTAG